MWWHFLSGSILCSHSNLLELWEVCEEEMEPTRLLLSYGLQWSVGRTKMASLVCKEEMEPARLLLNYGLRWSVGRTKMASLVCFLKIQKTIRKGRLRSSALSVPSSRMIRGAFSQPYLIWFTHDVVVAQSRAARGWAC
nr:hypothetical protein Iba_chr13bCG9650 [Ipomoea batatas]